MIVLNKNIITIIFDEVIDVKANDLTWSIYRNCGETTPFL